MMASTDKVPLIIGSYRLSKTLGLGAFGKVKLGEHIVTGIKVAVKILNKAKIATYEMEEKVRREINILKLIRHPHVIRLYEVIDTPTDIFLVTEFAPGGELFDYIVSKGRPTPEEAQRLFQQILSAVEYCHFHRIVHRDLKPENLLLDKDCNLKIADFGLSNIMVDGEFLRTSCGSPNYAAPEVITGNLYAGPEVDVWSMGVILYALLCGSLPFDDESIPSLFRKIKSGMYSLSSHLSPLTRDLIPRMLVVDPMKRITIPEIRQHPWFLQNLPSYLTLTPKQLEAQAGRLDEEVLDALLRLPFPHMSRQRLLQALTQNRRGRAFDQLRVAYELMLGNKHTKERLQDCVNNTRRLLSTPPAFTPKRIDSPQTAGARNFRQGSGAEGGGEVVAAAANILNRQYPAMQVGAGGRPSATPHTFMPPNKASPAHQPPGQFGTGSTNGSQSGSSRSSLSGVPGGMVPFAGGGPAAQAAAAAAASAAKRRRWYLGIQSKKDPAHVMTEVYRALLQLGCEWRILTSYGIYCRWYPSRPLPMDKNRQHSRSRLSPVNDGMVEGSGNGQGLGLLDPNYRVIVGLTLYKVQQSIYLLDFQKREGDQFTYMTLCAKVITQLKVLSAASKSSSIQVIGSGGPTPMQQFAAQMQNHSLPNPASMPLYHPPAPQPTQQQQQGQNQKQYPPQPPISHRPPQHL